MELKKITSNEDFRKLESSNDLSVIHFEADWAPQCTQMNEVMKELLNLPELKIVNFATLPAEDLPEISLKFKISAVPTFLLLRSGKVVDRIDGANAADLTAKIKVQAAKASLLDGVQAVILKTDDLNVRLKKLINNSECMLFMKGNPSAPRCGFSKTIVELLSKYNADYGSFDILSDEEVRQGLKKYSNWPTYPQLYIKGELVGGLDILKEMDVDGELEPILPKKISLNDSLTFKTFNILEDEEVRQGLKTYSNWPTYPQVYVNGELVGGLDIIKELKEEGTLIKTLKE